MGYLLDEYPVKVGQVWKHRKLDMTTTVTSIKGDFVALADYGDTWTPDQIHKYFVLVRDVSQ